MDGSPRLLVEDSPDPADLALLEEHVAAAAIAAAGGDDEQEFGIFVRDDDDHILAGISGIVWGGYGELHAMWVDESLRGRGLARALLAGAEAEAWRRVLRARRVPGLRPLGAGPLRAARLRDLRRHRRLSGRHRRPLVPQEPVSPARSRRRNFDHEHQRDRVCGGGRWS